MNNFDESSSGTNIELTVQYDNDLSSIYYEEFASKNVRLDFGRDSAVFLLGDVTKPYYKKSELNKMKKDELIDLDQKYQCLCPYDYTEYTKKELIDELKNVTIKQYYEYLISEYSWHNLRDNITHNYYISNGYSQGDAVYIISIDEELNNKLRKYIDHVLWDTPIFIRLEVDGEEFNDDDLLDDMYEYDKNSVIEKVKKLDISEDAKEWVIDNLPNEPKY